MGIVVVLVVVVVVAEVVMVELVSVASSGKRNTSSVGSAVVCRDVHEELRELG